MELGLLVRFPEQLETRIPKVFQIIFKSDDLDQRVVRRDNIPYPAMGLADFDSADAVTTDGDAPIPGIPRRARRSLLT